jgi:hypothetical protein
MLREATYPPAAVNVLDVSSESMAAFQVFLYGRFWVFTEGTFHTMANTHVRNTPRETGGTPIDASRLVPKMVGSNNHLT